MKHRSVNRLGYFFTVLSVLMLSWTVSFHTHKTETKAETCTVCVAGQTFRVSTPSTASVLPLSQEPQFLIVHSEEKVFLPFFKTSLFLRGPPSIVSA